jgi:putative membrane protein
VALAFYSLTAAALFAPFAIVWAIVAARQTVNHTRWAEVGDAVIYADGWIWRRVLIVRLAKIQVVTLGESPFDRRHRMASVHVDTAGASGGSVVEIPYLARTAADVLHARLAAAAASTQLKW